MMEGSKVSDIMKDLNIQVNPNDFIPATEEEK